MEFYRELYKDSRQRKKDKLPAKIFEVGEFTNHFSKIQSEEIDERVLDKSVKLLGT
jgi:hypothetical protein